MRKSTKALTGGSGNFDLTSHAQALSRRLAFDERDPDRTSGDGCLQQRRVVPLALADIGECHEEATTRPATRAVPVGAGGGV